MAKAQSDNSAEPAGPDDLEESWLVNEDESDRHLIRNQLALSPAQRLQTLAASYSLYRIGQQRIGRKVHGSTG